ncbi:MAG: BatA and WFA domain-containing protein [Planctomycetaceae bacterium]|jgi:uncharacterized spore protein YtfJ|nr:BatA and WFA domain-containing protein [Planctomycetaceae bacterium]
MTFVTLSIFFGGVVLAVFPVLLHLLFRGKPRRLEFPALIFLKKKLDVNRRSYRLKHIFLLLLRVAAILLFGLVLSRPSLKYFDWLGWLPDYFTFSSSADTSDSPEFRGVGGWSGLGTQDAPVSSVIVVDTSMRMEYVTANRSRLEVARQFADWILSRTPSGSEVAVLTTDREAAVFQIDMLAAKNKIERIQAAPSSRAVADVTIDALNLLASSKFEQRELYILTDLSEAGWSDKLNDTLLRLIANLKNTSQTDQKNNKTKNTNSDNTNSDNTNSDDSDDSDDSTPTQQKTFFDNDKWLEIFVVDVGVNSPTDTAIVNLKVSPQVAVPQSTIDIEAQISNIGQECSRTIDLILVGEGGSGETIRDTKTVLFPDGESQRTVSFAMTGFNSGIYQGKIQFTVSDSLEFDDKMFFTVQVLPPSKILLVSDVPVRDTSLFVRQALVTVPFEVETIPFQELSGKTAGELHQFNAVMLLDPISLDAANWKKLADYVSTGGGVGVFLGANAAPLSSFNDPIASEVIGAKLVRHARSSEDELWVMPSNQSTPILTSFKQYGELDQFYWDTQMVFRYWEVTDLSPRADIAMTYTDGRPAIITQTIGRGRTTTITTPMSELNNTQPKWNNLPRSDASWMFVLLMEGVAKYLTGTSEQKYIFQVDEPVVIRPTVEKMPETALLGMPDGQSIRLTPDTINKQISITAKLETGNFRIRSGGSQGSLDTGFSVNYSNNETILRKISKEQLNKLLGKNNYHLVKKTEEIEQKIARRRVGTELYTSLIILLAILFAAEYIFSNYFYRIKTESITK